MNLAQDALARPVTAAIRAGFAWSVRHDRPEAWREVARMTGVIMRALGPKAGPATPAELIPLLRRPLGEWLPTCDPALASLVILDADDVLTDDTYDIGCDYTVELLSGQKDPGAGWLPSWRTHRAEQVENAVFKRLVAGSEEEYAAGRRFLVEHPAGSVGTILTQQAALGLPPVATFGPIPHHQQWNGWWWGCPVCAWPMIVDRSRLVRCRFAPHQAVYTLLGGDRLQPASGAPRAAAARPAERAVCVDESVWRYIVVPGVVEVRLHDRIAALPGVTTQLYPGKDRYDISVQGAGKALSIDVKDYGSAAALAARVTRQPIAADHLVIPRYRRHQLTELRRLIPSVISSTEDQMYRRVKEAMS